MAKSKQALDPEYQKVLQKVVRYIAEVVSDEEIFAVDGTPMVTTKLLNGTFRKQGMVPTQEFLFDGIYIGAKGRPIFTFKPVDKQAYQQMELEEKQLDSVLPMFTPYVAEIFKIESEDIKQVIALLVKHEIEAMERMVEEAKRRDKNRYEDNPLFGAF